MYFVAASLLFTEGKASGLSVDFLLTFFFVVVSVATSSLYREVCEDCFGGEKAVVVVEAVSGDKLDKKTKKNEIQNCISRRQAILSPGHRELFPSLGFVQLLSRHLPSFSTVDAPLITRELETSAVLFHWDLTQKEF